MIFFNNFLFELKNLIKEKWFFITVGFILLVISISFSGVVYEATDFHPTVKARFFLKSIVAAERGYGVLKILLPFFIVFVVEIFVRERNHSIEDIIFSKPVDPISILFSKVLASFVYIIGIIFIMFGVALTYIVIKKEGPIELIYFAKLWWLLIPTIIYFLGLLTLFHAIFWRREGVYGLYFAYLISFITSTQWGIPFPEIHWWMDPFPLQRGMFYSDLWGFGLLSQLIYANRLLFTFIGLFLFSVSAVIWEKRLIGKIKLSKVIISIILFSFSCFYTIKIVGIERGHKIFSQSEDHKNELISLQNELMPIFKKGSITTYVDLDKLKIKGKSNFTLYNLANKPLWRTVLIMEPKISIKDSSSSIAPTEFTRLKKEGFLEIKFLHSIKPKDSVNINFDWELDLSDRTILRKDGGIIYFDRILLPYFNPSIYDYSEIYYPNVELKINVPKDFSAITQGELISKIEKDNFVEYTYNIGLYVPPFAVIIGKYNCLKDSLVSLYYIPKHKKEAEKMLSVISSAISTFSQIYGEPYFKNLRVVQSPLSPWGGFATPYFWVMSERFFYAAKDSYDHFIAVHETSHQWWPMPFIQNLEMGAPAFHLLIEAMANFSTLYWAEKHWPKEKVKAIIDDLYMGEYRRERAPDVEKPLAYIYQSEQRKQESLAAISYTKGAFVLYMLKNIVGDSVFFSATREFINKYKFKRGATFFDLLNLIKEKTNQDISWFTDQWIYGRGLPDYTIKKHKLKEDNGKYILEVEVANEGKLRMPVTIEVYDKDNRETQEIWLGEKESKNVEFCLNFKPTGVEINPNRAIFEANTWNNFRSFK